MTQEKPLRAQQPVPAEEWVISRHSSLPRSSLSVPMPAGATPPPPASSGNSTKVEQPK